MRLGFVCNPYHRGGITRWMTDMAVAWCRHGGESWFVAPRPRTPFVNNGGRPAVLDLLEPRAAGLRLRVSAPPVGARYEFGTATYRASIYAAAIRRDIPAGVSLVVSDDPAAWLAAATVTRRNPLIGVLHSDGDNYYALARSYARAAGALVCVSHRIAARARREIGKLRVPVVAIPCGTPLSPLASRADPSERSPLRLVWVGRMDEAQKRVSDLPKIAQRLRAAGMTFSLDIVGDGPEYQATDRAITALGLEQHVRVHGWKSPADVGAIMDAADVLLLPSNYEGMPMVVAEATARGCAVVASRVSGVEDYESSPLARDCFWLYSVGEVEEAVERIAAAAATGRVERVTAARRLAEAEFSIDVCVRRYADVLTRIVSESDRRPVRMSARAIAALSSFPIATQRIVRVWARRRWRSGKAAVDRHH